MTDQQPTGRRADRSGAQQTGRRADGGRNRKIDVVIVLAMILPTVVVVALALNEDDSLPPLALLPPTSAPLTDASVVCPGAAVPGDVSLTRSPGVQGGRAEVRTGATRLAPGSPVDVVPDRLATVKEDSAPVEISGHEAAAPGLVAGRGGPTAPAECRAPAFDEWFVGLGAAARNSSELELVNPDGGRAIVDVALYGPHGPIRSEDLRGITVGPHQVRTIDLSETIPRRVDLAAHVTVTQGRVVSTFRHTIDELGQSRVTTDYRLSQLAPQTQNLLLGVPDSGPRRLFVMNPGQDELRAQVQVVTADATFTPEGAKDIVVGPEEQGWVNLDSYLPKDAMKDSLGLLVTSSEPAAVGVRTLVDDDVAQFSSLPRIDRDAVAVLPTGDKRLILGDADRTGVVRVTSTDASGKVLDTQDVEVGSGKASELDLPADAVAVTVQSRTTPVAGEVLVSGPPSDPGLGVVRLRDAEVEAEVPVVRPD